MKVEPDVINRLQCAKHAASLHNDCSFVLSREEAGTDQLYKIGKLFVPKFTETCKVHHYGNNRFNVETLLMKLLISCTGHHLFA